MKPAMAIEPSSVLEHGEKQRERFLGLIDSTHPILLEFISK